MKIQSIVDIRTGETTIVDNRTEAEKAAEVRFERTRAVRVEVRRRILLVASLATQTNLAAARSAGLLTKTQTQAHDSLLKFISDTRSAGQRLIEDTEADVSDDANWPKVSTAAARLADKF